MGLFRRKREQVEPHPPDTDYEYTYELQIAGVSIGGEYGDRQLAISSVGLSRGCPLDLVREPQNRHDRNAVAVYARGQQLGYVPAFKSEMTAEYLDKVRAVDARVLQITCWEDRRGRDLLGVLMWLGFKR
jgi:hypothetical protein